MNVGVFQFRQWLSRLVISLCRCMACCSVWISCLCAAQAADSPIALTAAVMCKQKIELLADAVPLVRDALGYQLTTVVAENKKAAKLVNDGFKGFAAAVVGAYNAGYSLPPSPPPSLTPPPHPSLPPSLALSLPLPPPSLPSPSLPPSLSLSLSPPLPPSLPPTLPPSLPPSLPLSLSLSLSLSPEPRNWLLPRNSQLCSWHGNGEAAYRVHSIRMWVISQVPGSNSIYSFVTPTGRFPKCFVGMGHRTFLNGIFTAV